MAKGFISSLRIFPLTACFVGVLFTLTACTNAPVIPATETDIQAEAEQKATTPRPRDKDYDWMSIESWYEYFQDDVNIAKAGDVDLLFVGDSITQGWPSPLWENYFGAYRPANFGIGGDHTGNVLWRLQHGELENLSPRAIVLLIGINNFFHNGDTSEDVFKGVKAVVAQLQTSFPETRILLNGVLPHKENADDPMRQLIIETNHLIRTLGDEELVFYRDYGSLLLEPDGSISLEIMPDTLHLAEPGYKIWAEAMFPLLDNWLGQ